MGEGARGFGDRTVGSSLASSKVEVSESSKDLSPGAVKRPDSLGKGAGLLKGDGGLSGVRVVVAVDP